MNNILDRPSPAALATTAESAPKRAQSRRRGPRRPGFDATRAVLAVLAACVAFVGVASVAVAQDFPVLPPVRAHEVAPIGDDVRVPVPELVDEIPTLRSVRPLRLELVVPLQVVPGWAAPLEPSLLNINLHGILLDDDASGTQVEPVSVDDESEPEFIDVQLPEGLIERPIHQLELQAPIVMPDVEDAD